jgi:CPA2 family monovalent cation:H+ antiporter-2
VQQHAPRVPVIVRTIDDSDLETLKGAGATGVVPEAIEGSLMLASHALALMGVPMRRVIRLTREAREARYGLLRGFFHGADDDESGEQSQARLASVTIPPNAVAAGLTVAETGVNADGVQVVSLRLSNGRVLAPNMEQRLAAGDTLVLAGLPEPLLAAEEKLTTGA